MWYGERDEGLNNKPVRVLGSEARLAPRGGRRVPEQYVKQAFLKGRIAQLVRAVAS